MKFTSIALMFTNLEDSKQNSNAHDGIKKKHVFLKWYIRH